MVNLFPKKIGSVYHELNLRNTPIPFDFNDCFTNIVFTLEDIDESISNLNPTVSARPDELHPLLVINCSLTIRLWLKDLFNPALKLCFFFTEWKISYHLITNLEIFQMLIIIA